MKLTFLEATGGIRLAKYIGRDGTKPYPNVKNVTSHEVIVPKGDIKGFENALRTFSEDGMCLLKGPLRGPLKNESRRGCTDNVAYAEFIVIDIDNATLPIFKVPEKMDKNDLAAAAAQVVGLLPPMFHDVSYIAQASASLGLKGDKVSMHLYFVLETPLPPKAVKMWMRALNMSTGHFREQVTLSATGSALRYPIDPSVADNSKLIFIAPPVFEDKEQDPFTNPNDRIVRITRPKNTVELGAVFASVNPELVQTQLNEKKDELRAKQGLPKKKARTQIVSHGDGQIEIVLNPDRVTIAVVDDTHYPFIRCNINGGDSNAYWFNVDDPVFMYNFKDEPAFEIEKADPDFFSTIHERFAKHGAQEKRPSRPVVMRDFATDTYWNGIFDPNLNQFSVEYPLTPTSKNSIESFMKTHGRSPPSYIPDAKIVFEPGKEFDAVQLDNPPYYVNLYSHTDYMLKASKEVDSLGYGSATKLAKYCPTIHKIMWHMLGNGSVEYEHFVNWLAYIYQHKNKAMTAWVLTGVPGTGKGLFVNRVLKPLFGDIHVPMRSMENIEEQFNHYLRMALFLVVDEFRMADARLGTTRIADKLKNMITEPYLTIRGMRANQIELPSYVNFLFLTNRMDAVKVDDGDRRYNIAPRQEKKILDQYPDLVVHLDQIDDELYRFAGVLQKFNVDAHMARTVLANKAKTTMRTLTMSVYEEFLDAVRRGDLQYFVDVLEISVTNTFEAGTITSAQRTVRMWITDAALGARSIITTDALRQVYLAYAQPHPQPSPRDFAKACQRAALESGRRRQPEYYGVGPTPVRGYEVTWTTPPEEIEALVFDYLDEKERKVAKGSAA